MNFSLIIVKIWVGFFIVVYLRLSAFGWSTTKEAIYILLSCMPLKDWSLCDIFCCFLFRIYDLDRLFIFYLFNLLKRSISFLFKLLVPAIKLINLFLKIFYHLCVLRSLSHMSHLLFICFCFFFIKLGSAIKKKFLSFA